MLRHQFTELFDVPEDCDVDDPTLHTVAELIISLRRLDPTDRVRIARIDPGDVFGAFAELCVKPANEPEIVYAILAVDL